MAIDEKKFGQYGQKANRYQENYGNERKEPKFNEALKSLHNADEAMLAAKELVEQLNGRVFVGQAVNHRNLDQLDAKELQFLRHLATARVELINAYNCFKALSVAKNNKYAGNLVGWTEGDLEDLDKNLREISVGVLNKVEELCEDIKPEKGKGIAEAVALPEPDIAAMASVLETRFPGSSPDVYHAAAADMANMVLGKGAEIG